jgi:hypothetical protein
LQWNKLQKNIQNDGRWRWKDMTAIVVEQRSRFKSAYGDGLM